MEDSYVRIGGVLTACTTRYLINGVLTAIPETPGTEITLVGSSVEELDRAVDGTVGTITRPAGTQAGDLLIAAMAGASATLPAQMAGWNQMETVTYGPQMRALWRWATDTDPASWQWEGNSAKAAFTCTSWRGVNTTSPFDVLRETAVSETAFPATPAVTTVTAGTAILVIGGTIGPSGDTDITWTGSGVEAVRATSKAAGTTNAGTVQGYGVVTAATMYAPTVAPVETVDRGGVIVAALRPASTPSQPPAQEQPGATTGGAGGTLTDQTFVSHTDAAGTTSAFHVFAAGLDWSRPVGALIYGDGSGEFGLYNPTSSDPGFNYLLGGTNGLIAVAKRHNLLLITPMAPGTDCPDGGGVCWYQTSSGITPEQKVAWSRSVVDRVYGLYDLDRSRIVLGGYSSGAQWLTEYFGPAHASQVMDDGVAVAISYGGTPQVTPQHTAAHKATVPYIWDTGDQDPAWTDKDSQYRIPQGKAWYDANGFTTQLHLVAGEDHYRDGQFGAVMDREITEHVTPA